MSAIVVGQLVQWAPSRGLLRVGTVMAVYSMEANGRTSGNIAVVDPLDSSSLSNVFLDDLRPFEGGVQA